ncbi:hypothetical protein KDA11_02230 [Candidatus Saccharibacteria bacterium]|nr:hypothetical protein [Candidatus Saccharibacteria bacterium]
MDPQTQQTPYMPPDSNHSSGLPPYMPPSMQPYYPPSASTSSQYQPVNNAMPTDSSLSPYPPLNPMTGSVSPVPNTAGDFSAINPREELINKLLSANNVLVTVSNNPSVDQLSAAIGITLILNKLDKHATAVYSGNTPSVIEFLQPEKTIEKNTDSLRDFIIALDKAKADKLRYKVEDKFVKIFITPYHTSLSQEDLEFSQGDFNVDVVIAIGVSKREELDEAITAHGRILHDAVTASVNNNQHSDLGSINWFEPDASSLCEMLVGLIEPIQGDKALLDEQIATAFLTGLVAETERFSNEKTSPRTMNMAATLMKAGANQQLVASKLNVQPAVSGSDTINNQRLDDIAKESNSSVTSEVKPNNDGSLAIDHKVEESTVTPTKTLSDLEKENKANKETSGDNDLAKIHIDDEGRLVPAGAPQDSAKPLAEQSASATSSNMVLQPPTLGGDLSSATRGIQNASDASLTDQKSQETDSNINGRLAHARVIQPLNESQKISGQTLDEIERSVSSPHVMSNDNADNARRAVADAVNASTPSSYEPIAALNAQPINLDSPSSTSQSSSATFDQASTPSMPTTSQSPTPTPISENSAQDLTTEDIFPTQLIGPDNIAPVNNTVGANDLSSPPPVPPPLMPPTL